MSVAGCGAESNHPQPSRDSGFDTGGQGGSTASLDAATGGSTAAAGSGGASSSGGAGVSDGPTETPGHALAGARCEIVFRCLVESATRSYGNVDLCTDRLALRYEPLLSLPSSSWTAGAMLTCAADYAAFQCSEYLRNRVPTSCIPAPGALADGRSCSDASQCASGACLNPGAVCGTCGSKLPDGSSCTDSTQCEWACLGTGAKTCLAAAWVGDACVTGQCLPPSYCNSGTCALAGRIGSPCGTSLPCMAGLKCDTVSGACAQIPVVGVGETCATASAGGPVCIGATSSCDTSLATPACVADPDVGEACTGICQLPATCNGGTCQVYGSCGP